MHTNETEIKRNEAQTNEIQPNEAQLNEAQLDTVTGAGPIASGGIHVWVKP